ncbi:MAG TPA: protein translocase subunit SecF [Thermoanaerobaculia bacterium]|nr:protein translocase subunit SecF [Thermoanaerobaculia bacterium]
MEFLRDTNIDFMKYRKFWIIVSLVLVGLGVFAIFFHGRLNVGVDFAGGTQITIKFRDQPQVDNLRTLLNDAGVPEPQIQSFGREEERQVLIRTRLIEGAEEGSRDLVLAALDRSYNTDTGGKPDLNRVGTESAAALLLEADPDRVGARDPARVDAARAHYEKVAQSIFNLRREKKLFTGWEDLRGASDVSPAVLGFLQQNTAIGNFTVLGVENVGPQIGEELRRQGFLAVIMSLLGMLIYIWVRFELRFGIGAIMACVHDVLVTLGLFALFGFEFNLTTIAAFLTLIGYSVNDTVVIFDRIRENMRKGRREPLIVTMNKSLNQTLSRTLLTGGSTLLALACLLYWGGDVIRGFAFVMFVGIIVGTYSSIYVASPFALVWEQMFGAQARARRDATSPAATKAG